MRRTLLALRIAQIEKKSEAGESHISVEISDKPLWYISSDAELRAVPEVYASALLLPSLLSNDRLKFTEPLSKKWLEGIRQLLPIYNEWWGLPILVPDAEEFAEPAAKKAAATAVCFTGGVDSFYSLLRGAHKITHMVFAHGFDIPHNDERRMHAFESSLRHVAKTLDINAIVVRTNLRQHPAYSKVPWNQSHGGALASVGHALSNNFGTLVIPSSYTYGNEQPLGTSWETDSFWSSERLEIVHDEAALRRIEKLRELVNEPLVRNHLRVCWENRVPEGNCSSCEKCVRTMICISAWASLSDFSVFDHSIPLAKRIDQLPSISPHLDAGYRDFLDREIDGDVKKAIRRLLARSHSRYRLIQWRAVRRALRISARIGKHLQRHRFQ